MPRIRLVHSKATEAGSLLDTLRSAGYAVDYDETISSATFPAIRKSPPDAFVIDLSRMPSHGREVAVFLRGQKATRNLPIVFVGGEPEKVEAIRKLLPDATYTDPKRLRSALHETLANRPEAPVVPEQMMARYASRTAAQKLGIVKGSTVALIDPPRNYAAIIGDLPAGAALEEEPTDDCAVTLWFVSDPQSCQASLRRMSGRATRSKLWILWRKGSAVTPSFLRVSAAAVGLVDYKVCSVDAHWSGMLFARRKDR